MASHLVRSTLIAMIIAVLPTAAAARTPTNTFGPSPTATASGTPTPTATRPPPRLAGDVSPDTARSGQRVDLDATDSDPTLQLAWQLEEAPGVAVVNDSGDGRVAHFIAPPVDETTIVTARLAVVNGGGRSIVFPVTVLPPDVAVVEVAVGSGYPGGSAPLQATLQPFGLALTAVEHEVGYDAYTPVAARHIGVPDCDAGPDLTATFAFVPDGCGGGATCTGVHAAVTSVSPIADGATLYTCRLALSEAEAPSEVGCSHRIDCRGGEGVTAAGDPVRMRCPSPLLHTAPYVLLDYASRPIQIEGHVTPVEPIVGDAVQVTYSVTGGGGLPRYVLEGAYPMLSGTTAVDESGPLGDVTFSLRAECPGVAPLQLRVQYETLSGCPGQTYFRFVQQTSPVMPLTIRDPSGFRLTGRVAALPAGCQGGAPFARVRLDPPGWMVEADANGDFAFDAVPPGDYTIATEEECGEFQCWTAQPVHVGDADTVATLCPQRLAGDACAGDCDLDGAVHIDELIVGVDMALGGRTFAACPAGDADGDGLIRITDLLASVGAALHGCGESDAGTPSGVYDAVGISGLALVQRRGDGLRIDVNAAIGEYIGLDAAPAGDGRFTLSGGGFRSGDLAFEASGEAVIADDGGTTRLQIVLDVFNAVFSDEQITFSLERPAAGTPESLGGTHVLRLHHNPRPIGTFTSSIELAIDLPASGRGACAATVDRAADDDRVLAQLRAGECLVSPRGRFMHWVPYDSGEQFPPPLQLSGVLSPDPIGSFVIGVAPVLEDTGTWD